MSEIWLVWRIDFDAMENREPISRSIVGFCTSEKQADAAILRQPHNVYEGFQGGWSGQRCSYPVYKTQRVLSVDP